MMNIRTGIIGGCLIVLLLAGLSFGFGGMTSVEPGEVGILVKNFGDNKGMVKDHTLTTGVSWINPWTFDAIVYDTRVTKHEIVNLDAQTGDGQPIDLDLTLNVWLDGALVPNLHERLGPSFYNGRVEPTLLSAIKNSTSSESSDHIYTGGGRREVQEGIERDLEAALSPFGIKTSVNLQNLRFKNADYVRILEQKAGAAQAEEINRRNAVAAEQEAIRVENVAKGQKAKAIQEAEASRESLRLQGEGARLRDEATAQGNLALAKAEAEGLRLKNEALSGTGAKFIASMEWARYMGPNVKVYGVPTGSPNSSTFMFDEAMRNVMVGAAAGTATSGR